MERLRKLKIYSLQRRRVRYYIIYTWKILEGIVPSPLFEDKRGITNQHLPRLGRTCYRHALQSTSQRHNTFYKQVFSMLVPSFSMVYPWKSETSPIVPRKLSRRGFTSSWACCQMSLLFHTTLPQEQWGSTSSWARFNTPA